MKGILKLYESNKKKGYPITGNLIVSFVRLFKCKHIDEEEALKAFTTVEFVNDIRNFQFVLLTEQLVMPINEVFTEYLQQFPEPQPNNKLVQMAEYGLHTIEQYRKMVKQIELGKQKDQANQTHDKKIIEFKIYECEAIQEPIESIASERQLIENVITNIKHIADYTNYTSKLPDFQSHYNMFMTQYITELISLQDVTEQVCLTEVVLPKKIAALQLEAIKIEYCACSLFHKCKV